MKSNMIRPMHLKMHTLNTNNDTEKYESKSNLRMHLKMHTLNEVLRLSSVLQGPWD